MRRNMVRRLTLATLVGLAFCPATHSAAQDKLLEAKTIRVIVGFSPGGGFDAHSRAIARPIGKHIQGKATVTVETMPGADS